MSKKITREYELFEYDELSERAKEAAVNWWLEVSSGDQWWESVYEDAEQAGIKIKGFDCGRGQDISGHFTQSAEKVARYIVANHGEACETRKTADAYWIEFSKLNPEEDEDEIEELGEQFEKSILEDYLAILGKELEWVNSRENVEENIRANEYTFLENGKRFD